MVRDMNSVQHFKNGLTVRELKELIKNWPEVDEHGDEAEVWVEDEYGISNPVRSVWPLNSVDILFEMKVND